ncbi:hypothetical protein WH47_05335, partial [Habropoda laboriosa]
RASRILLQHDNARPHAANLTKMALRNLGCEVLYSIRSTRFDELPPFSLSPKFSKWIFLPQRRGTVKIAARLARVRNSGIFQAKNPRTIRIGSSIIHVKYL